jgi:seryl-tRNA synthetase
VTEGRTLIVLLEDGQGADEPVVVPESLRPYLDGVARVAPP